MDGSIDRGRGSPVALLPSATTFRVPTELYWDTHVARPPPRFKPGLGWVLRGHALAVLRSQEVGMWKDDRREQLRF